MLRRPTHTIEIPTADGVVVRGDLYAPGDRAPSGVVILCHGFKGFKTWGFFPYLAGRLCEGGLAAYAIDFSFNGTFPEQRVKEEPRGDSTTAAPLRQTRYPRAELFRANTLKREVDDLASTLRFIAKNGLDETVDRAAPVGLFGHSRGAVSAMLNAIERGCVKALCTWSAPDHPDHFSARQKALWRRYGEYDFTDAVDGRSLSLSVGYLDDLENNHDRYDLSRRATELRISHLVVHGEMDLVVPVENARALHEAGRALPARRLLVLRTGHTFGVADPPGMNTDDPPHALMDACDATVDWFATYLTKGI